jgi:hypothetical protein
MPTTRCFSTPMGNVGHDNRPKMRTKSNGGTAQAAMSVPCGRPWGGRLRWRKETVLVEGKETQAHETTRYCCAG